MTWKYLKSIILNQRPERPYSEGINHFVFDGFFSKYAMWFINVIKQHYCHVRYSLVILDTPLSFLRNLAQ